MPAVFDGAVAAFHAMCCGEGFRPLKKAILRVKLVLAKGCFLLCLLAGLFYGVQTVGCGRPSATEVVEDADAVASAVAAPVVDQKPAAGLTRHLEQPWFRWTMVVLFGLPSPLTLLLGVLFFWVAGRCLLYSRFTARALDRIPQDWREPTLLKKQEAFVQRLETIVMLSHRDGTPRVVAVRGGWGSGKSFLLDVFRRRLESADPKAVVVPVDVWRHSTESDLHLALFDTLLSHPRVPPGWGFFRYPWSLLPVLILRYGARTFKRGEIEVKGLKVGLTMPALLWQSALERTAAAIRRSGQRLVWVLDEIDRCSPEMAQAAIVLTRRALSLPGSVIILPYVAEQLGFKVFNILRPMRPDLHSTMQAITLNYAMNVDPSRSFAAAFERHAGKPRTPDEAAEDSIKDDDNKPSTKPPFPVAAAVDQEQRLSVELSNWYRDAPESVRRRLAFLFEEKYLSMPIPMPSVSYDDVPDILAGFPTLKRCSDWLSAHCRLDGVEGLRSAIVLSLRHNLGAADSLRLPHPAPTLRHLEGALMEMLGWLEDEVEVLGNSGYAPGVRELRAAFLVVVCLAYRRASEVSRSVLMGDFEDE